MPEITAAPYQREKGQLRVLASTVLNALQKSPGASASAGVFLCDAHHQLRIWQCRSRKVLNEIPNQLNLIRFLLWLFSVSPGWHPVTSRRASPWETQLIDLEVCSGITVSQGKEKQISNNRAFFFLFRWIINMQCFVLFYKLCFLTQQWFSWRYHLPLTTSPALFPPAPFPSLTACTLMPLNIGGYLLHHPPVQIATSLTRSCVFMQLENMSRLLRKEIDILTCFHYLCWFFVNAVGIIGQLSPYTRKFLQLHREKKENPSTMDFRKLHMKSDVHLAKSQYMLHVNCTVFMPNEDVAHSLRKASKIQ